VRRALGLRQERPHAFAGDYEPLYALGPEAAHVVAFVRGGEVVTVVPRLLLGLAAGWTETALELPPGIWSDRLTGAHGLRGELPVAALLSEFPVALLARDS
jgi:(1->4)-alpha-D-glucan 1-alpha-D-glucosylmutase